MSADRDGSVEPHLLCRYCQEICARSSIINTLIEYGNDETYEELQQRCMSEKRQEVFGPYSASEIRSGFLAGCHLCSMLWRSRPWLKMQGFSFEKNGIRKPILAIDCGRSDDVMRISLCTPGEGGEILLGGFDLYGYVIRDSQEPDLGPSFPIQLSKRPTPKQVAEIIKFWFKECAQKHQGCIMHHESILTSDVRPTRLLDVSNLNHIWLHTRNLRASRRTEYLTLSHCWPSDGEIFKLTQQNLESLKRQIPPGKLTQTFRDAIAITNAAGFQYLWIDSLCIVQDSPQDWAIEANRMVHVYGNAALNLVACGPPGATMLEPRNPLRYYPCSLSTGTCSLYVEPQSKRVEDIPAFKRGWIVQERLLSRRNIYFSMKSQLGEVVWECFEGKATETKSVFLKANYVDLAMPFYIHDTEHKAYFEHLLDAIRRLQDDSANGWAQARLDFSRMWTRIILIYTTAELTYVTDKLVAFTGIAKLMSQNIPSDYIAGMWKFTLPASLLWFTNGGPEKNPLRERPMWRGAPSWSWASLDTEIDGRWAEILDPTISQDFGNYHAALGDCETQLVMGRPAAFGEYASVKLHISGVLRSIQGTIAWDDDESPNTDGSREFGPGLVKSVLFLPDVRVPVGAPLFFFTIFRDQAANCYYQPPNLHIDYMEEGLVLMNHLDGYARVGYMKVRLHEDDDKDVLANILRGGWEIGDNCTLLVCYALVFSTNRLFITPTIEKTRKT